MLKVLTIYNIKYKKVPLTVKSAWLSGFFEGCGYVNINKNNYQIMLSISQKTNIILELIPTMNSVNTYLAG